MSIFQRGILTLRSSCVEIVSCRQFGSDLKIPPAPQKTRLYDFHVKNGGKMVDFAGYLLPVQYSDLGIAASHLFTRRNASIFDVSHMQQTFLRGSDCVECFETLCPADVRGLKPNASTLTVFTTEKGTIFDDLIVTKIAENCLYVVSNAAMKSQDKEIMQNAVRSFQSRDKDVTIEFLTTDERSLLAVQGPKSVGLVQNLTKFDLAGLHFMSTVETELAGIPKCRITRCGYTGEDGVEISVPAENTLELTETILNLNRDQIKMAGLGARDSLRLEAGLCLYGSDIDTNTTPVEAALSWLIAKRRRTAANFPGAEIIIGQLQKSVAIQRRRIGFRMTAGGPPARHGTEIFASGSDRPEKIGVVTSGCPSPCLGGNIGMGYVRDEFKKADIEIQLKIRDRFYPGTITKMPFVPTGYYSADSK